LTLWLNQIGLENVEELSFHNIYCVIQESENELIIKKDESFKSKPYLLPFKVFSIISILHIWLSITCILFSLLESSLINSFIIVIIGYFISYIFHRQYKHYKGRNIEFTFDKLLFEIKLQRILPKSIDLGLFRYLHIQAIILNRNYLDPERTNLSFLLKNNKKIEFFEGEMDDCLSIGNIFSIMLGKPIYFKEKLNWVLISCNLGFIFLLFTSIILNDIIGQIFFLASLIFSNIFNLTSIFEVNHRTK